MTFDRVIEALNNGGSARRISWTENKEIVKQIPQCIAKDIVPKMTSLPEIVKPKVGTVGSGEISYHDQVIAITFTDDENTPASATYFIPTWEDIFADDWSVLIPADDSDLPPHVARMFNEQKELCDKVEKLGAFINKNPIFEKLAKDEQHDMKLQLQAMSMYSDVLQSRLDRAVPAEK